MSLDNIKKQAKRLCKIWPELSDLKHKEQIELSSAQEVVARQYNYPDFHAAVMSNKAAQQSELAQAAGDSQESGSDRRADAQPGEEKSSSSPADMFFFEDPQSRFPNGSISDFLAGAAYVDRFAKLGSIPPKDHPYWRDPVTLIGTFYYQRGAQPYSLPVYAIAYAGEEYSTANTPEGVNRISRAMPHFDCHAPMPVYWVLCIAPSEIDPKDLGIDIRTLYEPWAKKQAQRFGRSLPEPRYSVALESETGFKSITMTLEDRTRETFFIEDELVSWIREILKTGSTGWYDRFMIRSMYEQAKTMRLFEPGSPGRTLRRSMVMPFEYMDPPYDGIFNSAYGATYLGAMQGQVRMPAGQTFHELAIDLARKHAVVAVALKMIKWVKSESDF